MGADRPRQPPAVMTQNVLTVVTGDELAASTLAVDLGAAVAVQDVRPELVKRRGYDMTASPAVRQVARTRVRMLRPSECITWPARGGQGGSWPHRGVGGQRGMFAEWLTLGLGQRWRRQSGRLVR